MSAEMTGHKNSSTTFIWGTLPAKATDFAILIRLRVFQNSQFNLLSLMLVLLGSGLRLLPFLSTTTKSQYKMKSGLLLNVVVKVHPSFSCLPAKISLFWSGGIPSLSWTLTFTFSMVSEGSTWEWWSSPSASPRKSAPWRWFHHRWRIRSSFKYF